MSSHPNPKQPAKVEVLVLAAGLGTRMKSATAKVLHKLDGRPLIAHVCRAAAELDPRAITVVVGHQAGDVKKAVEAELGEQRASFALQENQKGTGDAVLAAEQSLTDRDATIMILSGDVPLIKPETLRSLLEKHHADEAVSTILTVRLENPFGYGRVVRDDAGEFVKIVEQKDASDEERQLREINSGIYCFAAGKLFDALKKIQPNNTQREYYLTDAPALLKSSGGRGELYLSNDAPEVSGLNTRAELAEF